MIIFAALSRRKMQFTELNKHTVKQVRLAVQAYFFMAGLCFTSWASRIPDIKTSLGMDDAGWGSMLFMVPLGQIIGMLFSGRVVTRFGSRNIMRLAFVAYSLALVAIGLSQSVISLGVSLVVFGFFGNFCNISENTQAVTVENYCGKPIMATFHGGWSLAGLAGGAFGLLMTSIGIPPALHFAFILLIIIVLSITCFRFLQPDLLTDANGEKVAKTGRKPEKFLYLLGIVCFFGMAAEGSMSDWNGLYLKDIVGVKESLAPLGLTVYMLTMASGRFLMDSVTQRWGRRRVLQGSGLAIFIGLALAVALPGLYTSLIGFMIVGVGTCGVVPTVYSTAGEKSAIPTGRALVIVSSISFLGFLLGPPVIGYISELTNLRVSYALIALFGLCIAIFGSQLRVLKK